MELYLYTAPHEEIIHRIIKEIEGKVSTVMPFVTALEHESSDRLDLRYRTPAAAIAIPVTR